MNRGRGGSASGVALSSLRLGCLADERGSASLLVALWAGVLTTLAGAAVVLTSVLAARESLSAATDLAALAGASATVLDPDRACARAALTARANGASVTDCRIEGVEVWVAARAPAPPSVRWLLPGRAGSLRARAHAELAAGPP